MIIKQTSKSSAFTIVELLVVVVVIGILAAITIVSYTGVSKKAKEASLQSDLTGASKQLEMYKVDNSYYPKSINGDNCPLNSGNIVDTRYCLKSSSGNTYNYEPGSPVDNAQTYSLNATDPGSTVVYTITNSSAPTIADLIPTVIIGTQFWMKYNMNVGTKVNGGVNQSIGQKWCYANLESNCTSGGGLYQWDTAMKGSTTEAAQGICPTGFHIPTDTEYKTLEKYLGMSQVDADTIGERGTDQATKLINGGSSGFNLLLTGQYWGWFDYVGVFGGVWTSSQYSVEPTAAWYRSFDTGYYPGLVNRFASDKTDNFSVRCLKN
ncbi:MAG: FISUMP domain-containing protein [Candidatus Saccharibacteria bacterium]